MDQATARCHPLGTLRFQQPFVTGVIAMTHPAGEHIGHRFKTAVRVVGEAPDIVIRIIVTKRVEHQKRIEPLLQILGQDARETHTRAIGCLDTLHEPFNASEILGGHHALLESAGRRKLADRKRRFRQTSYPAFLQPWQTTESRLRRPSPSLQRKRTRHRSCPGNPAPS